MSCWEVPWGASAPRPSARLAQAGPNELPAARRPPVIWKFLAQLTSLFAVVPLAASAITLCSYLVQSPRDAGNLELAVAILGVVLLNAAIGFFQEHSAERTAEALQAMVPRRTTWRSTTSP
jgi:Ca2+-transporting ATPase